MMDTTTSAQTPSDATDATPAPLPSFDALPLSQDMRLTLADIGYEVPTPVQLAVWEPATRGKDAVVQARTGTGKTASFGIPIVDSIVRRSLGEAQVLVLCPTRELAVQGATELDRLGKRKGVKVVPIYGGAPMPRQIEAIAGGAQVIVGTPGRVLDHLRRGTLDPKGIKLLVLDECDEMLSMGFERELNAILDLLPPNRQTLLFSATLPPDIERIARNKLKQPEVVTLSGDHIGALEIDHFVYFISTDKLSALMRIVEVENPESAVVFCNTRDETERVAQALARQGYDADWLNGDLPQSDRETVMSKTREGRLRYLVATDVAARGIDISHLTHVINFDFPQDAESYVHRTGRTGRAGRTGTAISLVTPRDIGGLYILRLTYKIRPLEKRVPSDGELKTRAEADLVTMLADAFLPKGAHPDDLALARRLLSHNEAEAVVAGLLREYLGARPTVVDEAAAARRAAARPIPRVKTPGRRVGTLQGRPVAPASPGPVSASPATPEAPATPLGSADAPAAAPTVPTETPAAVAPGAEAPPPPRTFDEPRARREPRERRDGFERADGRDPRDRREPRGDARDPRDRRETRDLRDRRDRRDGPRPERPRRDATPVNAAENPAISGADPAQPRPTRHADFATWEPPVEEGDDQPIWGTGSGPAPAAAPASPSPPPAAPAPDSDFVELFVSVGRRDNVKASDVLAVLEARGGLNSADVRRIRVRERHGFVSVQKACVEKALQALNGAALGGKTVTAEIARERPSEDGGAPPAAS